MDFHLAGDVQDVALVPLPPWPRALPRRRGAAARRRRRQRDGRGHGRAQPRDEVSELFAVERAVLVGVVLLEQLLGLAVEEVAKRRQDRCCRQLLMRQVKSVEAEEMQRKVLVVEMRVMGPEHPSTEHLSL